MQRKEIRNKLKGLEGKAMSTELVIDKVQAKFNIKHISTYSANASTPWTTIRFDKVDLNIKYGEDDKILKVNARVYMGEVDEK